MARSPCDSIIRRADFTDSFPKRTSLLWNAVHLLMPMRVLVCVSRAFDALSCTFHRIAGNVLPSVTLRLEDASFFLVFFCILVGTMFARKARPLFFEGIGINELAWSTTYLLCACSFTVAGVVLVGSCSAFGASLFNDDRTLCDKLPWPACRLMITLDMPVV